MNKETLNKMGISTYELVEDFIFVDNKVKAVNKSDESEGNDQFLKSLDYFYWKILTINSQILGPFSDIESYLKYWKILR